MKRERETERVRERRSGLGFCRRLVDGACFITSVDVSFLFSTLYLGGSEKSRAQR